MRILILLLSASAALAQLRSTTPITNTPAPAPSCTDNIPYQYFVGTGIGLDSGAISSQTGFGIKAGTCSNVMLDTYVSTGLGHNATGISSLTEHAEYHVAHTSYFSFIADSALGVAQVTATVPNTAGTSSSSTAPLFTGGFAVSADMGYWLSKKKFHLPVVGHMDWTVIPGVSVPNGGLPVKANYTFEVRKTFGGQ